MSNIEPNDIKIGLVIMASGLGKRFGGNKLMAELGDKPLIKWIIDTTDGLFEERVVVTRYNDVKDLCNISGIECIVHDFPGRNDTVRLGLNAIMDEVDYCFFIPGDQPLIGKETASSLVKKAKKNKDYIVRTSYGDIAGAPVGFPKQLFNELLNLPEGKGGNLIAKKNPQLVHTVEVQHEYELWDVDTVDDLRKIKDILHK